MALILLTEFSSGQVAYKHSINSTREDFKILRGVLEESHAGVYWYRTKAEIDTHFDAAYLSLDHEMTELEYLRIVAPLISKIGCGHTWIATSEATQEKIWEDGKVLPMKLKFVKDKAYCLQNNSHDSLSIQAGDEVLSINNYSIDSLIKLSNKFSPGDAFIETGKSILLGKVFNQFYTLYIGQPDKYLIKFRNRREDEKEIRMEALYLKEIELISVRRYPQKKATESNGNINLQFLMSDSTALLRIKEFDDWKSGRKKIKFKVQLVKCFQEINSAKSKNLIIDLRNNDGGNEKYGLNLYSHLTSSPFTGYKQIDLRTTHFRYKKYSNTNRFEYLLVKTLLRRKKINDTTYLVTNDKATGEYQPHKNPFKGKIYILINGASFSTTSDFTALAQSNKIATFIGEETGGSYLGNTSNYSFLITL
ncbi:MAG: S41 family peptidase, partial [Leadbetterella sp.]